MDKAFFAVAQIFTHANFHPRKFSPTQIFTGANFAAFGPHFVDKKMV